MRLATRTTIAVGISVTFLAILLVASVVRADHANWIHEQHPECCGHEDCNPVSAAAVGVDGDYYVIKHPTYGSFNIAVTSAKISKDQDYWICLGQYGLYPKYFMRCFFRPMVGA